MDEQEFKEIVEKIINGKKDEFSKIIQSFQKKIFQIAMGFFRNREEAMDLTQEALIKIFQNLNKWKHNKSFSAWVFTITNNLCIDRYRKIKKEKIDASKIYEKILPGNEYLDSTIKIEKALDNLPPKEKMLISMKYFNDMKLMEISEVLNISLGTTKSILHRGIKKIRKYVFSSEESGNE
ncbi:MAG: sigma-70 family RNA polymerase sigma factor [Acidobacteriota bacterium]